MKTQTKWITGSGILVIMVLVLGLIFVVLPEEKDENFEPSIASPPSDFRNCVATDIQGSIENFELSSFSVNISHSVLSCQTEVVLAPIFADLDLLILASRLASIDASPLLIYEILNTDGNSYQLNPEVAEELLRLQPKRINFIGNAAFVAGIKEQLRESGLIDVEFFQINSSNATEIVDETQKRLAYKELQLRQLEIDEVLENEILAGLPTQPLNPDSDPDHKILQLLAAVKNSANLVFETVTIDSGEASQSSEAISVKMAKEAANSNNPPQGPVWILHPKDYTLALIAIPLLEALDGELLFLSGDDDVRASSILGNHISNTSAPVRFIGRKNENTEWQFNVLKYSDPLPSGKYLLFENERMVAFYGKIGSPGSGVLGNYKTSAEAFNGLVPYANEYKTEGFSSTPVFEIIATTASAAPGDDGDYSIVSPWETILPWVEAAKEMGAYVVLDLQPGRTDFLTQAKLYEPLLLYENVGLALDPEWRLKPDEFHLEQIGQVQGEEVNEVVDWLATLVRENNLPQKLLVLHQFRTWMLVNRQIIKSPPELAINIHMDGLGNPEEKLQTYQVVAVPATQDEPERFWGWKNFFAQDDPTPTPEYVLGLNPQPLFVSYQ